jgi:hypothetical protein
VIEEGNGNTEENPQREKRTFEETDSSLLERLLGLRCKKLAQGTQTWCHV